MSVDTFKPVRLILLVALTALTLTPLSVIAKVDLVKVDKSKRRMYLLENNHILREYRIALGKNPQGHKQHEGDKKTPEGQYTLDYIVPNSQFYKAMHISYPNKQDLSRANTQGVSPGGGISIHGLMNGDQRDPRFIQSFDWTNGCIAISNTDMDDFLAQVQVGTPILIEW